MSPTLTMRQVELLLTVVRLGDGDRLGWWQSHSADEVAAYVLANMLPTTWQATGIELGMESARIRHNKALDREAVVHLFSDYLPFRRELRAWLIARKLELDLLPLEWIAGASINELRARLGGPTRGDRRRDGIYMGDIRRDSLDDQAVVAEVFTRLIGAYPGQDNQFLAPYLDLI